jgi:hypothetical protein
MTSSLILARSQFTLSGLRRISHDAGGPASCARVVQRHSCAARSSLFVPGPWIGAGFGKLGRTAARHFMADDSAQRLRPRITFYDKDWLFAPAIEVGQQMDFPGDVSVCCKVLFSGLFLS